MSRIPLAWGDGAFDVLLDLSTMEFLKYASEDDAVIIHNRYGGRALYTSMSGRTGSGWVAQTPGLRRVNTYRTDVVNQFEWAPALSEISESLPGFNVLVPIQGGSNGTISLEWPVVITKNDPPEQLYMVHPEAVADVILGNEDKFEDRDYRFELIQNEESDLEEVTYVIRVPRRRFGTPWYPYVEVLKTLYSSELHFQTEEEFQRHPFWTPLGLRRVGNHFYKVVQRRAVARYTPEELSTLEGLKAIAPANVRVLSPLLYIQDRTTHLVAVGRCTVNGIEIAVEKEISVQASIMAFSGQISAVHTIVAQAIAEKSQTITKPKTEQTGGEPRTVSIHS